MLGRYLLINTGLPLVIQVCVAKIRLVFKCDFDKLRYTIV